MAPIELILLTDLNFENPSSAGFNRVMCYAKSLVKENVSVKIYSSRYLYQAKVEKILIENKIQTFTSPKTNSFKSTYEDFHFARFLKFFRTVYRMNSLTTPDHRRAYLLYNSNLASVIICLLYFKIYKKCKIIIEKNELKTAIAINRTPNNKSWVKASILFLFKPILIACGFLTDAFAVLFDGIIVISSSFEKLYHGINRNLIKIPILASDESNSSDNFIQTVEFDNGSFRIGYFGWIGEPKDGVFSLVNAISKANLECNYNISIDLYGKGLKYNIEKLNEICSKNRMVKYFGSISVHEVKLLLKTYDLLAFPRPLNLQTRFGFSTKLAEFMLSGVPVLTSSVSDNNLYVDNEFNGFLIKASRKIDMENLSNKLLEIISLDKFKLKSIGMEGRRTALYHFDPIRYSETFSNFLRRIV